MSSTPTSIDALIRLTPTPLISDYEKCSEIGNFVPKTYPRQCVGDSGEVFEEELPREIIFSQIYGETGHTETAYSILSTTDGGYLITGQVGIAQCLIRKVDATGEKEWEHVLGEQLREEFDFTNGLFTCWSARQVIDGGYVIVGTGRQEMGMKSNAFLLMLAGDGSRKSVQEFRWRSGMSLRLDKEGNPLWLSLFGLAGDLVETSDNGYAVVGRIWDHAPDDSMHVFRADTNGNYLWERNLCQDKNVREEWEKKVVCANDNLWDGLQTHDGGFVFTGGNNPIWLVKTDSDGFIEWVKSYDATSSHAVIQSSDGGFLIAGDQHEDGLLLKTDSNGSLQWHKTFGGEGYDTFTRMMLNSDGEIIVIGSTESFGEGAENIWFLGIDLSKLE